MLKEFEGLCKRLVSINGSIDKTVLNAVLQAAPEGDRAQLTRGILVVVACLRDEKRDVAYIAAWVAQELRITLGLTPDPAAAEPA